MTDTRRNHMKQAITNRSLLENLSEGSRVLRQVLERLVGQHREILSAMERATKTNETLTATNRMLATQCDRLIREKETMMKIIGQCTVARINTETPRDRAITELDKAIGLKERMNANSHN